MNIEFKSIISSYVSVQSACMAACLPCKQLKNFKSYNVEAFRRFPVPDPESPENGSDKFVHSNVSLVWRPASGRIPGLSLLQSAVEYSV